MENEHREVWAYVRGRKDDKKASKLGDKISLSKGKQAYVRNSKKRTTFGSYKEGKLDFEMKKVFQVRGMRADSSSSSSVFDSEEGQLMGLGKSKEAQSSSTEDGLIPLVDKSSSRGSGFGVSKKILVRHKDQKVVSILDQEGRDINLPLRGPIQFPLQDLEGGQNRAEDLMSIPLAVEIDEEVRRGNKKNKKLEVVRWSLQEEIAKVIAKGISLGYVFNARDKETEGSKTQVGDKDEEQSWSLGVEITKVIEVGVALGVDFNSKEDSIGKEIA
ncbi:hypothetical protein LWI29_032546 [Acer saccharum]|uniref:Uncharacterized protein n=1 Tax=Acer saccharum TaxID=4024 RepID=A0AA39RM50_ACESA|nr:hypothetical protein LWI29_032546 [Acer saccharum]